MFFTLGGTPMADFALRCLLITLTFSVCTLVGCAAVRWMRGSPSTPSRKPKPSLETIATSETPSALAAVIADQAALFSAFESMAKTVKRLSTRNAMRDAREAGPPGSSSAPPVGTSKTELRRFYGLSGKAGPAFVSRQLELETNTDERTN